LAEVTLNQQKNKTGIVGTVSYMPPEIFSGYFSTKSDVWSCGIIMCMLLIGYNPYKRKNQTQTVNTIQN
jgi:serine/threonine protein kinase